MSKNSTKSSLWCEICNIPIQSEVVMRDHEQGKKHTMNLRNFERQQALAEVSVFVRDFPPHLASSDIEAYFNGFGPVKRVIFDTRKGMFAIVEFTSKDLAQQILRRGRTQGLFINGCRITVCPRRPKPRPPPKKKKPETSDAPPGYDLDSVLDLLTGCESMSDQMMKLQEHVQLNHEDIETRQKIVSRLTHIFSAFFPGCQIRQFGSSVNGFAVKESDMDLFLDMGDCSAPPDYVCPLEMPFLPQKIHNRFTKRNPDGTPIVNTDDLLNMKPGDRITVLSKILLHCSKGEFNEVLTITSARTPIVKFTHAPSGINCDLTLDNRLALKNTQLISMFTQIDDRIAPLIFTIRYWAKHKEASRGKTGPGPMLNNYALTMLCIFYLQNTAPPILPPVAPPEGEEHEECVIDSWDCYYCEDIDKFRESAKKNEESIVSLLEGFFTFYSHFDFVHQIVCPRTGVSLDVVTLQGVKETDEKLEKFKVSFMNVQDPFVLSHNISGNVNNKVKLNLQTHLAQACAKIENKTKYHQQQDSPTCHWGLAFLLDNQMEEIATPLGKEIKPHAPDGNDYSFPVYMKNCASLMQEAGVKKMKFRWCQLACFYVLRILKEILYFDVEIMTDNLAEMEKSCESDNVVTHNQVKNDTSVQNTEDNDALLQTEANKTSPNHIGPMSTTNKNCGSGNKSNTSDSTCAFDSDKNNDDLSVGDTINVNESDIPSTSINTSSKVPYSCGDTTAAKNSAISNDNDESFLTNTDAIEKQSIEKSAVLAALKSHRVKAETAHEEMEVESSAPHRDSESDLTPKSERKHPELSPLKTNTANADSGTKAPVESPVSEPKCKKYKLDETRTKIMSLKCSTKHRLWNARKSARRSLIGEIADDFELEVGVSKCIIEDQCGTQKTSLGDVCSFIMDITQDISAAQTSLYFRFSPTMNEVEFLQFYPFVRSFVTKKLDKYLQ